MGLYGDKLTLGSGTAVDSLAKGSTAINVILVKSAGTAFDGLAKSAGSEADNLAKSAGTAFDGLQGFGSLLTNGNFEGSSYAGLASGWTCPSGTHAIEDPGINGKSQKLTAYGTDDIIFYQNFSAIIDNRKLRLNLKYYTESSARLTILQRGSEEVIYSEIVTPESNVNLEVLFDAIGMTGLEIQLTSVSLNDYIILDDIVLQGFNQDNLTYSI